MICCRLSLCCLAFLLLRLGTTPRNFIFNRERNSSEHRWKPLHVATQRSKKRAFIAPLNTSKLIQPCTCWNEHLSLLRRNFHRFQFHIFFFLLMRLHGLVYEPKIFHGKWFGNNFIFSFSLRFLISNSPSQRGFIFRSASLFPFVRRWLSRKTKTKAAQAAIWKYFEELSHSCFVCVAVDDDDDGTAEDLSCMHCYPKLLLFKRSPLQQYLITT